MKLFWSFVENIVTVSFIRQELLCAHHCRWVEWVDLGIRIRDKEEGHRA